MKKIQRYIFIVLITTLMVPFQNCSNSGFVVDQKMSSSLGTESSSSTNPEGTDPEGSDSSSAPNPGYQDRYIDEYDADSGRQLYVSKSGNDTNNCESAASACKTIQRGLNILTPGDVLNIDAGTYIEDSTNSVLTSKCGLLDANYGSLCVKSSGTKEKPIVIRALPGKEGKVVIDSEGKRAGIIISKMDYIQIKNLKFINSWTGGIATPGGPAGMFSETYLSIGCLIQGNIIENTTGAYGVNNSAIYLWSTKDWVIRNNYINGVFCEGTTSCNGMQTYGTVNALIENNTVKNTEHGINLKDHYITTDSSGNIIHTFESVIRNNHFMTTQTGIRISIRGDKSNPAGHNQIIGNIIELPLSTTVAIGIYLAGASRESGDIEIQNNLIVSNSGGDGIKVDSVRSLKMIGNVFAGIDVDLTLRLQNDSPAKLVASDFNVFDNTVHIQNDKYSSDEENYRTLSSWQAAKPSQDNTITSLQFDHPDTHSKQVDPSTILSKASSNYKDAVEPIAIGNGQYYQPGPYQTGITLIGASIAP